MSPKHSLSPSTHKKIVKLHQQNVSIRSIAKELDVAKSTVADIWKLYKEVADVYTDLILTITELYLLSTNHSPETKTISFFF